LPIVSCTKPDGKHRGFFCRVGISIIRPEVGK
jgi:hypothetical protein